MSEWVGLISQLEDKYVQQINSQIGHDMESIEKLCDRIQVELEKCISNGITFDETGKVKLYEVSYYMLYNVVEDTCPKTRENNRNKIKTELIRKYKKNIEWILSRKINNNTHKFEINETINVDTSIFKQQTIGVNILLKRI